tara:strand:- start:10504 stop:10932 length:429 start_codon:yes stop_codon:yes gene_type:complete
MADMVTARITIREGAIAFREGERELFDQYVASQPDGEASLTVRRESSSRTQGADEYYHDLLSYIATEPGVRRSVDELARLLEAFILGLTTESLENPETGDGIEVQRSRTTRDLSMEEFYAYCEDVKILAKRLWNINIEREWR